MSTYKVKSIKLPLFVSKHGDKDQPTLINVIKSVLTYCNQMPQMCEIVNVGDEYRNNHELLFEIDKDKYRFFDVISPVSIFYGIKYGDELVVRRLYQSKFIWALKVLAQSEDILRLIGIEVQYQDSFLDQLLKHDDGEEDNV